MQQTDFDRHGDAPARTFGEEARKLERVRCSSLVNWPVYPLEPYHAVVRASAQIGDASGWAARFFWVSANGAAQRFPARPKPAWSPRLDGGKRQMIGRQ